jgi:hypothetical protein
LTASEPPPPVALCLDSAAFATPSGSSNMMTATCKGVS